MSNQDVKRWTEEAMKQEEINPVNMPIDVFLLEADGMTRFIKLFWEPAEDGSRPGLSTVANQLAETTADDISSLVRACRTVHTRILWPEDLLADRKGLVKRARFLVDELSAACDFAADDGLPEPLDVALSEAKERANADDTVANLVQTLADYADIAASIQERLAALGDFDTAVIEEAKQLVEKLSEGGPPQPGRPSSPEIDLRNRLLSLLVQQVRKVRAAVRYVFRRHPDIVRKVSSAYQRRKRSVTRKKKEEGDSTAPAAPQPATPVVATPI